MRFLRSFLAFVVYVVLASQLQGCKNALFFGGNSVEDKRTEGSATQKNPEGTEPYPVKKNWDKRVYTNKNTPVDIVLDCEVCVPGKPNSQEIEVVTPGKVGKSTINKNVIKYTPNKDVVGEDLVVYSTKGSDKEGKITIVIVDDSATVTTKRNVPIDIILEKFIPEENKNSTDIVINLPEPKKQDTEIGVTLPPLGGTIKKKTENGEVIIYFPKPDFQGEDIFTVEIVISSTKTIIVCIKVIVEGGTKVVTTPPDTQIEIIIGQENSNPPTTQNTEIDIEFVIGQQPTNGTVEINFPNIIYIPNKGYTGKDVFTYIPINIPGATPVVVNVEIVVIGGTPCDAKTGCNPPPTTNCSKGYGCMPVCSADGSDHFYKDEHTDVPLASGYTTLQEKTFTIEKDNTPFHAVASLWTETVGNFSTDQQVRLEMLVDGKRCSGDSNYKPGVSGMPTLVNTTCLLPLKAGQHKVTTKVYSQTTKQKLVYNNLGYQVRCDARYVDFNEKIDTIDLVIGVNPIINKTCQVKAGEEILISAHVCSKLKSNPIQSQSPNQSAQLDILFNNESCSKADNYKRLSSEGDSIYINGACHITDITKDSSCNIQTNVIIDGNTQQNEYSNIGIIIIPPAGEKHVKEGHGVDMENNCMPNSNVCLIVLETVEVDAGTKGGFIDITGTLTTHGVKESTEDQYTKIKIFIDGEHKAFDQIWKKGIKVGETMNVDASLMIELTPGKHKVELVGWKYNTCQKHESHKLQYVMYHK